MAQYLRQLGGAELAGSTRAVRERGQPDAGLLIGRLLGHGRKPEVKGEGVKREQ
jgi:hypothetical protein